ncbi:MAG: MFS transporter, partial [Clostridium sp.]
MEQGYRQIFKQKEYMKMTGANFINRLGDSIDMIAFTWLVYELTGSASWSAVMLGVNMIPNVIVQPFAGAVVERMEKKRVMIVCDSLRGILTAAIAVLYMLSVLQPWMLLLI